MNLCVNSEPLPIGPALRRLITSSLGVLLGNGRVVAESLALPGSPILALDREGAPVLICFAVEDDAQAVLNGLGALEALTAHGAFWLPLCPDLAGLENLDALHLLVLVSSPPPGARQLVMRDGRVRMHTMRAVRVNGEAALMTEVLSTQPRLEPGPEPTSASRFRFGDVALDSTEKAFFEQL